MTNGQISSPTTLSEATQDGERGRPCTPTEVMEAAGYGKTQLWRALRALETEGQVVKEGRGTC